MTLEILNKAKFMPLNMFVCLVVWARMCASCRHARGSDYECVLSCACSVGVSVCLCRRPRCYGFGAGSPKGRSALMCGCSDAELLLFRQSASCVNTHACARAHVDDLCVVLLVRNLCFFF